MKACRHKFGWKEKLLEENGLRQGCTIAHVPFNPYACLVVERWMARITDKEGVGTYVQCKFDHMYSEDLPGLQRNVG